MFDRNGKRREMLAPAVQIGGIRGPETQMPGAGRAMRGDAALLAGSELGPGAKISSICAPQRRKAKRPGTARSSVRPKMRM